MENLVELFSSNIITNLFAINHVNQRGFARVFSAIYCSQHRCRCCRHFHCHQWSACFFLSKTQFDTKTGLKAWIRSKIALSAIPQKFNCIKSFVTICAFTCLSFHFSLKCCCCRRIRPLLLLMRLVPFLLKFSIQFSILFHI